MKFTELSESKNTKVDVQYQKTPHVGQRCQHCDWWIDSNQCSKVMGNISENGWCTLWEPISFKPQDTNESLLDEDWKRNLRRLVTVGALGLTAASGITSKLAYDKWVANHPQAVQALAHPISLPNPPEKAIPAPEPRIDTVQPTSNNPNIIRPKARPANLVPDEPAADTNLDQKKPRARPTLDSLGKFSKDLHQAAISSGISGDELIAFMAQAAHETGMFNDLEETGPAEYFNKYDPEFSPKTAAILGNTKKGDGFKFRGRGYMHLTGRENYERAGKALGLNLIAHPDLAADPAVAADIAVWYWKTRVQSNVSDFTNVKSVTKYINPKLNGLDDREEKYGYIDSLVNRFSIDIGESTKPRLFGWLKEGQNEI